MTMPIREFLCVLVLAIAASAIGVVAQTTSERKTISLPSGANPGMRIQLPAEGSTELPFDLKITGAKF